MEDGKWAWAVCAGAFVAVFCTAGLLVSAFPVYLPYIRSVYGYSNAQSTSLLTIRSITALLALLVLDHYHRKLGLRAGMSLAVLIASAGLFLYAVTGSYPGHCLASVLCGIGNGLGSGVAASILIHEWFTTKRAFAFGIVSASTGLASVIAPVVLVPVVERLSLQWASCAEGIFIAICGALAFALIRNKENTAAADVQPKQAKPAGKWIPELNLPWKTALLLTAGISLSGFVMHGEITVLASVYEERFGGVRMSFLTAIFGLALMGGKICYGRMADKMGAYKANYVMYALLMAGIIGTCVSGIFAMAVIFAVLIGIGSPISNVTVSVYAGDFSSREAFAKNVKWFNIAMTIFGMAANTSTGTVADWFGSYVPALLMIGVLAAVTGLLIQFVYWRRVKCGTAAE